uniref:G_PROTEIN_RECEP_F1_2 domain-containing protein n=1 Tax=Heterorhabditis bacteriophora TaxID=37862 RepID=A0A1I7XGD7_HETBA
MYPTVSSETSLTVSTQKSTPYIVYIGYLFPVVVMTLICCLMLQSSIYRHRKALTVNLCVMFFLIAYTLLGGFVFLHFEYNYAQFIKYNDTLTKKECIEKLLSGSV